MGQSCWDFVHKTTVPKQASATGGRSLVLDVEIKMGNWLAFITKIPFWLSACQEQESCWGCLSSTFLHSPIMSHWSGIT